MDYNLKIAPGWLEKILIRRDKEKMKNKPIIEDDEIDASLLYSEIENQ